MTSLPEPLDEPGTPATTSSKPARRITPKDVVGIVFGVLIVIFIVENGRKAKIRFVGPTVDTYLWLALLIAAAFGFVLGFAVAWQRGRAAVKTGKRR